MAGAAGTPRTAGVSRQLDLGGPLEPATMRVEEGDLDKARLRRAEGKAEGRILPDRCRGVELGDVAAGIAHYHTVDEAIVPVHGLAVFPLHALVGMDDQRAGDPGTRIFTSPRVLISRTPPPPRAPSA